MDTKLAKIYYSPQGYWKGTAAIKKLAEAAKVPEDSAKKWLKAGPLADLLACAATHSSPEIRRDDAQLGPPGGPSFSAP